MVFKFLTLIRVSSCVNECLEWFISTKWMLLNFYRQLTFLLSKEKYIYSDHLVEIVTNMIFEYHYFMSDLL